MNYDSFLQSGIEERALPYFEGKSVCDARMTYRLRDRLVPGWYRFRIEGRYATPQRPVFPCPERWNLPTMTGYVVRHRLVSLTTSPCLLFGLSDEEGLPRFAPVVAWRWFDGHAFFAHQDFETDVEIAVRLAFEDEESIAEIKGVTPALAQAFLLETAERALQRERERRILLEATERAERDARREWERSLAGRIALALSQSGAELIDWRNASASEAVVRYRLEGQRFECVVDTQNLQILDSGICLEGADRELNLSSLPSAVREAAATDQLYVFRNG